jgi:hypothetical protein
VVLVDSSFARTLVLAAACAAASAAIRVPAQAAHPPPVETVLDVPPFPAEVADPFSFGLRSVIADVCFLEAIQVYGSVHQSLTLAAGTPYDRQLARLLEYATELDPKFAGAYRFAGYVLPRSTTDGHVANVVPAEQILERGVRERPDDWKIAFTLGYIQAFYLDEPQRASEHLARAARMPGSPAYLGLLAARLAVEGGDLEAAEQMAQTMADEASEEQTRAEWRARLLDLQMERAIRTIEAAARLFRERTGRAPESISELVRSGDLSAVPVEPHGGRYTIEAGEVRSTAAERPRLRHREISRR